MYFEANHAYHIYNQGNNRQQIFFGRHNYLFFLKKMKLHVSPFADVLAWCLMPNHFHVMVHVNNTEIDLCKEQETQVASTCMLPKQTFNQSLGVMMASYTRAINKQENRTGSLFRKECKAECLTKTDGITPSWITVMGITRGFLDNPEKQYPCVCYNYILNNPVKDALVLEAEDWEFSSYRDAMGLRSGTLINREKIKEYGLDNYTRYTPGTI